MIKALVVLSVVALAMAAPEADAKADPYYGYYGLGHYGYAGYPYAYGGYYYGKGLLSLPLPPSLLLIPTTATTDFATMGTLATPTLMLVMAIITAKGLLRPLPLPSPSPTMATLALAIT